MHAQLLGVAVVVGRAPDISLQVGILCHEPLQLQLHLRHLLHMQKLLRAHRLKATQPNSIVTLLSTGPKLPRGINGSTSGHGLHTASGSKDRQRTFKA